MKKTKDLSTEQLIVHLAGSARVVTPLKPPFVRLILWMAVATVLSAIVVLAVGPRRDLSTAVVTPGFVASIVCLFVTMVAGAAAAFVLSVPGAERSWLQRALPVAAALAWPVVWAFLLATAAGSDGRTPGVFHAACAIEILGISAISGAILLAMIRRAAPLRPAWTAATISLSAIAVASAATQVMCPLSDPAHQLGGHVLVAAVVGVSGLLVAKNDLGSRFAPK